MANSNLTGLGSGIDFGVITDSIIASRSRPLTQLVNRQTNIQSRSAAVKQLNSGLITLQQAFSALKDSTLGSGLTATTSAKDVVTATATTSAPLGNINLQIDGLATNLIQSSNSFTSTQTPILANGATSATLELRKGGASTGTSITIDSSNNSLAGLRDSINSANAGIKASIIDGKGDGSQNYLLLSSTDIGSNGRVELVETSQTGTVDGLGIHNLNTPNNSFGDLDAKLKVNGLSITRSSNTISDITSGVTFTLKTTGSATISVNKDTNPLRDKISNLVSAFNGVQDLVNGQYKSDANGKPQGVLLGDANLHSIQGELRNIFNNANNNGGKFQNLTNIGISQDTNGRLTINQTQLDQSLKDSLTDVQALFAGKTSNNKGIATTLADSIDGLSQNLQSAITGFDASVKSINNSIIDQQNRLTALRSSLTHRFSVIDSAIGQINSQTSSLTSIVNSLSNNKN